MLASIRLSDTAPSGVEIIDHKELKNQRHMPTAVCVLQEFGCTDRLLERGFTWKARGCLCRGEESPSRDCSPIKWTSLRVGLVETFLGKILPENSKRHGWLLAVGCCRKNTGSIGKFLSRLNHHFSKCSVVSRLSRLVSEVTGSKSKSRVRLSTSDSGTEK